jgi:short chain dehydrogenase/Cytochrome C1 family
MTQNVEGKVVVITGASSGLGEATAQHLAAAGAKLVLGARRLDRLQALAGELGLGTDAAMQTDVTDREEVKALVDHAVTMHGHLDVIVNNAGLTSHSPLERGKVDDWDRMIEVNLKGVVYGVAADPAEKWAHHQRIVGRRPQGPYADGSPKTVQQYAKDVAAFLMWAAEPKLDERKRLGFRVLIFLVVYAGLLFLVKKKIWSRVKAKAGHDMS